MSVLETAVASDGAIDSPAEEAPIVSADGAAPATGMERALKLITTQRSTTKALQEAASCGDTSAVKMVIRAIKRRDGDEVGGRRVSQLLLGADHRGNTLMHAASKMHP